MVRRFLIGLGLGAAGGGVTYAIAHVAPLALIVGLVIAVVVWFGELILDDLT
ncbi:MAG: hypothetical protein HOV68_17740 [Streptomycetaceae bacterium]|nr:hypothetical protein [Streptomycetaceae bacterium]